MWESGSVSFHMLILRDSPKWGGCLQARSFEDLNFLNVLLQKQNFLWIFTFNMNCWLTRLILLIFFCLFRWTTSVFMTPPQLYKRFSLFQCFFFRFLQSSCSSIIGVSLSEFDSHGITPLHILLFWWVPLSSLEHHNNIVQAEISRTHSVHSTADSESQVYFD